MEKLEQIILPSGIQVNTDNKYYLKNKYTQNINAW